MVACRKPVNYIDVITKYVAPSTGEAQHVVVAGGARRNRRARRIAMPALPESRREAPSVRELAAAQSPDLVFFSSASENTRRFVDRLDVVGHEVLGTGPGLR